MLAGTLSTLKTIDEMQTLLLSTGLQLNLIEDEIELHGIANITLRPGFDHEYIVVADAVDKQILKNEVQSFSDILKDNLIKHEFEFYDMANELYDVIEYQMDALQIGS